MASLLLRKPRAAADAPPRTAIIDIGSNSIRLVVYQGPPRLPATLFNEKVMAGLGRQLAQTGRIAAASIDLAITTLARFAALAHEMEVTSLRTVATAAVRDAANGQMLLDAAARLGLPVETLTGEEEAIVAGMGVLSAIPDADGIVGDLGGGSLELVRVKKGEVRDRVSFPLGALRIAALRTKGKGAIDRRVAKLLKQGGWAGKGKGLPLYLVGGSWRSLARLDMHVQRYPLPIIQQYPMSPASVARLVRTASHIGKGALKAVPGISSQRAPMLNDAAALLASLLRHLKCDRTIVSSFGLREGLLYQALDPETRAQDPLIVAARADGQRLGRFPQHGDLLDRWIAPLFEDSPGMQRLRHAACLLADVGWHANPEFRAERGVEIALHGNWVGIDARGRAIVAQALWTSLGGGASAPAGIEPLASSADLKRGVQWGLAIRLGQRLSGGVAAPLRRSGLRLDGEVLRLRLTGNDVALYGEAVAKRHLALADAFGSRAVLDA
ncbi:Ppx/GppA family phosphatase [Sphingomonas sp.]|jgi:exopolyphosphatase/guanosine-5'-triphosphate,3'-diphosphate pyrophosphatase|uniref:Ppx/GppA family phosphatase n=1 Tax=Sphingomonas sp. TaxID=28214 RepID=UPI002E36DC37|nr:Ppx/GppA family phosphatase [Sphingomonas sp.]HEX4693737.1 Ppx/GppA family phosphatase [Sphingomonas sp.]